jgi:tripartite motif-containing protein 37
VAAFIAESEQLRTSAQTICQKPMPDLAMVLVPHNDFVCELVPPYEGGSFSLPNYTRLRESAQGHAAEALYSVPLHGSSGLMWRLKVYPNGNGVARDTYLSVFVELSQAPPG